MTKFSKITLSLTALVMAILLSACGSRRAAVTEKLTASEWHDVYMPVKINLVKPASMGFSARATMVRDSVINISVRVLGMEMAVAYMDRDSVWLVDKYHKVMFADSKAAVLGEKDYSVADIQNLIMGIRPGKEPRVAFDIAPGATGTVEYSDFVDTPAGLAASDVTLSVPIPGKAEVAASLAWNFSDARWDTNRRVTFNRPPASYKRVAVADILRMLNLVD